MRLASIGITIALCFVTRGALAQTRPMKGEAKAHFDRGSRYYDTQLYDEALAEFRLGYQVDPHRDFLYSIGQAERLRGNCKSAVEAYKAFLRTNPPPQEAALAQGNIGRCESPASVETGPKPAPDSKTAPEPAPPAAPPTAPPRPPSASAATGPWYTDWLGDALSGAGIALAAGGVVALFIGNGAAASANRASTLDEYESDASRAHGARTVGVVGLIGGGVLTAAGVVRYLTRPWGSSSAPPTVQVGGAIEKGGGVVAIVASF